MFNAPLTGSATLEVLARQRAVDAERGTRTFGSRHDGELNVVSVMLPATNTPGTFVASYCPQRIRPFLVSRHELDCELRLRDTWRVEEQRFACNASPALKNGTQPTFAAREFDDALFDQLDAVACQMFSFQFFQASRAIATQQDIGGPRSRCARHFHPRCRWPYTATGAPRTSHPSQYGHWWTLLPQNSSMRGKGGN